MNRFVSTIIVSTSHAPVLLIFSLIALHDNGIGADFITSIALFLLASILSLLTIHGCYLHGEIIPISIKKIESFDSLIIPFVTSNAIPAIMKAFGMSMVALRYTVVAIFALSFIVSYAPTHLILILFGFKFYKCETNDGLVLTLICKRNIRNIDTIRSVIRISENLYLENV